jgi:uncharacterized Ntn-hydrolase superfamily protein
LEPVFLASNRLLDLAQGNRERSSGTRAGSTWKDIMTWSIIAHDRATGWFGIAIATRFFAVGALCPMAEAGLGAVCSQALPNPTLRRRALDLLREGIAAPAAAPIVMAMDEGRDQRQLHLVDRRGRAGAFTGGACVDWCGHAAAEGVSVAGNMLAGPAVIERTLERYLASAELRLVERLLAALDAGEAAGGDKRGRQSAALLIQGHEPYPRLDLRVDDHPAPLEELRRLYAVAKERFIPFSHALPSATRPFGLTDREALELYIQRNAGRPLGPWVVDED